MRRTAVGRGRGARLSLFDLDEFGKLLPEGGTLAASAELASTWEQLTAGRQEHESVEIEVNVLATDGNVPDISVA